MNKKQKPIHKEVWTVKSYWSTENTGDVYEAKDLIVFNKEQVEQYLKDNYNINREGTEDLSNEDTLTFSFSAIYDENGNESSDGYDHENCEVREGFYEQTDTIEAYNDYTIVSEAQIQELKETFSPHVVIDLTEED